MSRTRAITSAELHTLLRRLDDPAKLAVRIAADTGLRVSDILALRGDQIAPTMRVQERKTGKTRTVRLRPATLKAAKAYAKYSGKYLIDRDRSTLYRQIRAAAADMPHVSMHSIRKYYAKRYCAAHGLRATQKELQHDYLSTTLLYVTDMEDF